MKTISAIFFLLGYFLCIQASFGRPNLDEQVQLFLNNPSTQKLKILVIFKDAPMMNKTRSENERALKQSLAIKERQLFSDFQMLQSAPVVEFWILHGLQMDLTAEQIRSLSKIATVESVHYIGRQIKYEVPLLSDAIDTATQYTWGLAKIGVPDVKAKHPELTGKGVLIGVLDTGIDASHPDLKDKLVEYRDFSPAKNPKPDDGFGHGTHVAGTIAGGNASGQAIGVASEAKLIVGRIFDGNGDSDEASILASMQWMADPDGNPDTHDFPRVVNNSWGDSEPFNKRDPQDDPFCKIVEAWKKLEIVGVFSAGNTGPKAGTTGLPAGCPEAMAVGATETFDRSPHFSSSGPAKWKSIEIVKPEISAPGVDVYSAKPRRDYEKMTGTSMAAPHVSGALALLLQAKPEASVERLATALYKGSKDLGPAGKDNDFGWGRVDLIRSLEVLKGSN